MIVLILRNEAGQNSGNAAEKVLLYLFDGYKKALDMGVLRFHFLARPPGEGAFHYRFIWLVYVRRISASTQPQNIGEISIPNYRIQIRFKT